ncbi:MAG: thermonuclease family protein [Desulfobacterium sp.]|nr:thermonuclease family protein [Desulfobacterium sp.]
MIIKIISLVLVFMAFTPCMGEIYQWTDTRGIKHFSNISPPDSGVAQKTIEQKILSPKINKETFQGPGFKVLAVYDGDSIKVEEIHKNTSMGPSKKTGLKLMVRLAGIDAPESGYKRRSGQPFSRKAKQMLEHLVAGKKISLKSHGMDTYNRQLAEVFVDGINVNLALVTAGMAEIYRGYPLKGLNMDQYRRAQEEAKKAYRGIWSLGPQYQSPRAWRKAHPRKQ